MVAALPSGALRPACCALCTSCCGCCSAASLRNPFVPAAPHSSMVESGAAEVCGPVVGVPSCPLCRSLDSSASRPLWKCVAWLAQSAIAACPPARLPPCAPLPLQMQLELMKQRAGTMFRQMAEKHAREISDMERAHEATIRAVESRRCGSRRPLPPPPPLPSAPHPHEAVIASV